MTARMSKREREAAQAQWRQEQQDRKDLEACIAEMEKQPGGVTIGNLDSLGLSLFKTTPALDFMVKRLNEIRPEDPEFTAKSNKAIVDLVASDITLDARARSLLAGTLHNLLFPNRERDRRIKEQLEVEVVEDMRRELLSRGMPALEVDYAIVESVGRSMGIKTVAALTKKIQRARDRVPQKTSRTKHTTHKD